MRYKAPSDLQVGRANTQGLRSGWCGFPFFRISQNQKQTNTVGLAKFL